jgi:hypothetical protein
MASSVLYASGELQSEFLGSGHSGNCDVLLTTLLRFGLSRISTSGRVCALNWICLKLGAELLKNPDKIDGAPYSAAGFPSCISVPYKQSIVKAMYSCLQSHLESRDADDSASNLGLSCSMLKDPVCFALLVDALAAAGSTDVYLNHQHFKVLSADCSSGHVKGAGCVVDGSQDSLSIRSKSAPRVSKSRIHNQSERERALISIPDALHWIVSSNRAHQDIISLSLCRFIGRLQPYERNVPGRVARKMSAALCAEGTLNVLFILLSSASESKSGSLVRAAGTLALWYILHRSEQAKSIVRGISLVSYLTERGAKNTKLREFKYYIDESLSRGEVAILNLLGHH